MIASLIAFLIAAGLLTITPGLDTAFVLRTAATGGARPAVFAVLGIVLGCLCWTVLVALGLGALLAVSQGAYTALKLAGAGYLIWLGWQMLRHPRRSFVAGEAMAGKNAFMRGALSNLLNPKVGVFYVSFLPQFVPAGYSPPSFIMLLGVVHALMGLAWLGGLIAATRPIVNVMRRERVLVALDRITGGLFTAFGLGLAWDGARAVSRAS
jgi:threonine/homoserine/homoserine lactone efflux protein